MLIGKPAKLEAFSDAKPHVLLSLSIWPTEQGSSHDAL